MKKKDIPNLPLNKLLIVSVVIRAEAYGPNCYRNNLIISIDSITHTHTIKSTKHPVDYYEMSTSILGKEFNPDDGDLISNGSEIIHEDFHHRHIILRKIWTPEDTPLTVNWKWISNPYKRIAFDGLSVEEALKEEYI